MPLGVDSTACLVEAQLRDRAASATAGPMAALLSAGSSESELRLQYAMAVVRMVNGIADSAQRGRVAASVASLAAAAGARWGWGGGRRVRQPGLLAQACWHAVMHHVRLAPASDRSCPAAPPSFAATLLVLNAHARRRLQGCPASWWTCATRPPTTSCPPWRRCGEPAGRSHSGRPWVGPGSAKHRGVQLIKSRRRPLRQRLF